MVSRNHLLENNFSIININRSQISSCGVQEFE